jgi:hypothetical protein
MSQPSPALKTTMTAESIVIDPDSAAELGTRLSEEYSRNTPFPHIVIENFIDPEAMRRVVSEFPQRKPGRFEDKHSSKKTGYQLAAIKSRFITNLLYELNSAAFLQFLENMTGIKGLISDPFFSGGGLHETGRGGHLSIHADFSIHERLHLRRRLNLILYLNENWPDEYGGHLELWDRDMKACQKAVPPRLGTAVIFNTDLDCYHGHPDPLNAPEGKYRRSIATYYFTAPDGLGDVPARTTRFMARPGTQDSSTKASVRMKELLRDFTPPIIARMMKKH